MGNKGKTLCGHCDKNIPKTVFRIQCNTCKKWHHPECANLSELEIRVICDQNKTWFCPKCRRHSILSFNNPVAHAVPQNTSISVQGRRSLVCGDQGNDFDSLRLLIIELKTEISGLKAEFASVKDSLEFFNTMYEEQKQTNKIMGEMIDEIKRENAKLKMDVQSLQNKMQHLETDQSGKCLVISGAFQQNDDREIIKKKSVKVLKFLNGTFTESSMENMKVFTPKNKAPIASITLKDEAAVTDILKKRKDKGNLNTLICGINGEQQRVFVNEEHNKVTYQLLKEAMKLKQKGYKYVWARKGSVLLRKNDGDQVIKVKDNEHLKSLSGLEV